MSGLEWYNDAIVINEYSVDNHPEILFISFPKSVTKSECRAIDKLTRLLVMIQQSSIKDKQL